MVEDRQAPTPLQLEHGRRAAKRLRKALIDGKPSAVARFRAAFGQRRDPAGATHADCLHIVAREEGAESWPRLKLAVETAAFDRVRRIATLERAAANGNFLMLDRLLALDPSLPNAHLGLQVALARDGAARATLDRDPGAATRPAGDRQPIHHLCFSKVHLRDPGVVDTQIALLDALLAAGATVNDGCPAEPGSTHQLSPLYGALGHAGNLRLAEALLARGADPNDNESLYHATELPGIDAVRLLFAHGARVGHTNAFLRMLDTENADGVRLFLANGADPNAPPYRHPTDTPAETRNALHHAIVRGRSGEIGGLLIDAGVNTESRYDGRTPFALARICGNWSMAAMLESRGLATDLSPTERFLSCIADGDGPGARQILADHPDLRDGLTMRDRTRQTELAIRPDSLPALRLMGELGFDPNLKGESEMPPIHAAAWWGRADIVAMYLEFRARLDIENMFGGDALGTAIHGSANCPGRDRGDYERVVRLLVAAGATIRPERGHLEMGSEEMTLLIEDLADSRVISP